VVPSLATRAREQKLELRLEVLVVLLEGFDADGSISLKLEHNDIGWMVCRCPILFYYLFVFTTIIIIIMSMFYDVV
jgi:hypothetical protein